MKKLYKSKYDRKLCGVCGGISEYLNIDSTIIRLVFILLGLTSSGIIFYILAALLMPEEI